MATSDKRWQLLLVADDGRIVPFKRVKGVVVTVMILIVLLGVLCAGLGWQWTAEKVRHRRTSDQLANAEQQLERYKRENELITAELVLAEVRMEKAGLPVTKRRERMRQPAPTTDKPDATAAPATDTADTHPPSDGTQAPAEADTPAATASAQADAQQDAAGPTPSPEPSVLSRPSAVALGDFSINHDTTKKILVARLRVTNKGPRSSPVAGQCVVVLKNDGQAPDNWMPMPAVDMVAGQPSGKQGRAFKIASFINMEILAPVQTDPSTFTTAVVYVFDPKGDVMLKQAFPITLPASAPAVAVKPEPPPASQEAVEDKPEKPAIAVEGLKLDHDASRQIISARFRVKNTASRSTPVSGRCVVVLKSDTLASDAWVSMPGVSLADGRPKGNRGQAFRIARFRDMEVKAIGVKDPSIFRTATVHVFGSAGDLLLERDFPIDLPAPKPAPEPKPEPEPETASEAAIAPTEPTVSAPIADTPTEFADDPGVVPAGQPSPGTTGPAAVADDAPPPVQPSESHTPAPVPPSPDKPQADDPSLTEEVESTPSDESRSRF
jgi:type II secretory pathway pseudopilin PulG